MKQLQNLREAIIIAHNRGKKQAEIADFLGISQGAVSKTIKLFAGAGLRTPFGPESTFRRRILLVPIEFRLDWVWLRGLEAASYGIDRKIGVSDHWPLWTNVKLSPGNLKSSAIKP